MQILSESGFFPKLAGEFLVQLQISLFFFLALNNSSGHDFSQLSDYQTTTWRVEDGLPQSTVTCIAQSADGYLWLGPQNGLVRFDGVKFRVFDENNTPAIKNSRIVRLLSDKDGTLWVGTEHSGLVCLRNGQFTVSSDSWSLSSPAAHALTCDVEGQIWVGTDSELAVLQEGRFQPVWGRMNEKNFQVDFLSPSRGGGAWVAANGRLRKFEAGHWTIDLGAYTWTNWPIYDLYEDRENRLWVATLGSGLFRYDTNGEVLHLTSQNGLPTDFVRCVTEDREGNIWVGTEGGGLCRLKQSIFQTYGVKQGLASDQVMAVAAAQDGGLWIGTDGDGLDHWKDGKVQHYGLNEGLGNGHAWSVIQDHHGIVWVGTWDGIYELDGGKFSGLSDGQTIRS